VARTHRRHELRAIDVDAVDPPERSDAQANVALRDQIERGFRRLTAEQRAVLVLHYYLGMSDAEAATTLDIPVGTYKSRLSRASVALRGALEAEERMPGLGTESLA
jgi:DNA-directed RNA polymerase specialized sigma24 family protein